MFLGSVICSYHMLFCWFANRDCSLPKHPDFKSLTTKFQVSSPQGSKDFVTTEYYLTLCIRCVLNVTIIIITDITKIYQFYCREKTLHQTLYLLSSHTHTHTHLTVSFIINENALFYVACTLLPS